MRVLPGLANGTAHFQRSTEPLFADLCANMKAWPDDFNLYVATEGKMLDCLRTIFAICRRRSIYLSARKSVLFTREIKWCGRLISGYGYKIEPSNPSGLRYMHLPVTAHKLLQFLKCCKWMALVIPQFVQSASVLTALL